MNNRERELQAMCAKEEAYIIAEKANANDNLDALRERNKRLTANSRRRERRAEARRQKRESA